uniref:Lon proteolytic domain-containing protein n=1 Tax=viral metagenome TaxID=1070528 RepID=A0A6C0BAN5_9ZZZZ
MGIVDENTNDEKKNDPVILVHKKIVFFEDIIQKTIIHIQKNKYLDVLGISEVNTCIQLLHEISKKMQNLSQKKETMTVDAAISELQIINNELSSLFRVYGTESFDDLLHICFGNNKNEANEKEKEKEKYEILQKYFHPTSYKVIKYGESETNPSKKNGNLYSEKMNHLDCNDIFSTVRSFHMKVYGVKLYFHQHSQQKTIVIYGIVDDVVLKFMQNSYIVQFKKSIVDFLPQDISSNEMNMQLFHEFMRSLTLKECLIYTYHEIYQKFFGIVTQFKLYKQKSLANMVKDFVYHELYVKRTILIQFLIHGGHCENRYIAYLLYDLLSNDANGVVDTAEQTILFDSFPWSIKDSFRDAMKKTIQYTNELTNFDVNKIPLEQQICLLKVPEMVKEKAMVKLKEIKSKSEDSGSKARQYLDGLLKIPFQIYRREKIMNVMENIKTEFKEIAPIKKNYTGAEILKFIYLNKANENVSIMNDKSIYQFLSTLQKEHLIEIVKKLNEYSVQYKYKDLIKYSKLKKVQLIEAIQVSYKRISPILKNELLLGFGIVNTITDGTITSITKKFDEISDYVSNVKETLNGAIHGHDHAKTQIERIICQWINGEQDGYCFGFEGPPGVGKTSLAKIGLSQCLKDENGEDRPFAMIQMGGDSNGSTLHGHNYTYVGSTWGSIVQILMDKKCMNPIIFIDELDKISRTEHGREIVGILTHLLDPTQNDSFQDKYFSGINLDLSQALFVLSYNDVDAIDKVLLDRIHRIKFSSLSLEDKLEIANLHMLPAIYKKMGMTGLIHFSREVLTLIIEEYTVEPGVRKLKEILLEIVGEINLDILKNKNINYIFPLDITIPDVKTKYFKDKNKVKVQKIHETSAIGVINGLWANSLGHGGIIPIQARFFPCETFMDLKLTGMQGDVMKESMNVSLTLAWTITDLERKDKINELYNQKNSNKSGIHIHCPEGSVPKDGPSAGAAITSVIYSILNNKRIKHSIAITGEISLDGKVTEIGGLDIKFIGGIKGGAKEFIFPRENLRDFEKFMGKYKENNLVKDIIFHSVDDISEVFELIFEK